MADAVRGYPLIFRFCEPVAGGAFVARVQACGRALAVQEPEGEWWFYGVEPGAMAESGSVAPEAYARFVAALRNVLQDAAAEAPTFEAFAQEVRRFFSQVDASEAARWAAAVTAFRAGGLRPEGPFDQLPRENAETPCEVKIELLGARPDFDAVQPEVGLLLRAA